MAAKTCAHVGCSCSVESDDLYCADTCRLAADNPPSASRGCDCMHPSCLGDAGKEGPEALESDVEPPEKGGGL